jgi:hypothetical protein
VSQSLFYHIQQDLNTLIPKYYKLHSLFLVLQDPEQRTPHKSFLNLWWKASYDFTRLKMHYNTHGWLVGWVLQQGLYFMLHWRVFTLEGPSNIKC